MDELGRVLGGELGLEGVRGRFEYVVFVRERDW